MDGADDWLSDPTAVEAFWRVLVREADHQRRPVPSNREELVILLRAARGRLRRRLLLAEGVDPRTGRPVA